MVFKTHLINRTKDTFIVLTPGNSKGFGSSVPRTEDQIRISDCKSQCCRSLPQPLRARSHTPTRLWAPGARLQSSPHTGHRLLTAPSRHPPLALTLVIRLSPTNLPAAVTISPVSLPLTSRKHPLMKSGVALSRFNTRVDDPTNWPLSCLNVSSSPSRSRPLQVPVSPVTYS